MSIEPGEKLGPYEIAEPIGKGGMGEVYRARDTRLGRDVALKVSAERFGERFEREARVISSLNHPNICTLHDVGENYLVMELVEGETLRDRIEQGPMPMEEALRFARQIAAALEAAHEQGVIHRDLKPGNVMVKEDGTIKVLDFGLAKAGPATMSGSSSGPDPEHSPTISMAATQAGVVLGTAAYMAPEQARGKPVDKRADIWSFGVVLYEMVTGRKLFAGEDLTDTLAAVVRDKPDLSEAPAELKPLLDKCLEKDPRNRLRDIGGIDTLLDLGQAQTARQGDAARPGRLGWIPVAGIAAAAALIAGLGAWLVKPPPPAPPEPQVVRTTLDTGALLPDATVALSEDGRQVVYVTDEGLRVWPLNSFESTLIPGTVGARVPFFSPDGQQVAYIDTNSNNSLKRISVNGGPSGVIVEETVGLGAKWMENGEILYSSGTGIFQVSANGGEPRVIVEDTGSSNTNFPQLMPDGKHIIYSINSGVPTREMILENLEDGTRRTLAIGSAGRYLKTGEHAGHLVFWTNQPTSQYLAIALDEDEDYAPVGAPFPLVDGIAVGVIPKVALPASLARLTSISVEQ